MQKNKSDKKEILLLMIAGCLLGILCFALIYGFKIVNPFYDGWMFYGDMDLKQHYIGFCHFRNSQWKFPIGLIDSLSVPYSMSVVYTDSIPFFALFFKLLNPILPVKFQYFGMFGLISFGMMGMLSPVLIRRFCKNKTVCLFGSLFFILSFTVIQRMYYHTALSAQWIIILAMIIWFYTDITDKKQLKRICIYWTLMGVLSVGIHSYFVFMCGFVLLAQIISGLLKECKKLTQVKDNLWQLLPMCCMGISSFALLYVLGGFYGAGSVSGDGFGSFNGNLSAFVNPLEFSSIFKGFPLNGMFEFEGFAYLGAGLLFLILLLLIVKLVNKFRNKEQSNQQAEKENNLPEKAVVLSMILIAVIVFLFACLPNYSFGSFRIISIPLPKFIRNMFGICRTNARFVWISMYFIITYVIWSVGKYYENNLIKVLFALAIIIQIFDISVKSSELNEKYRVDYNYTPFWEELESENIIDNKKEFVFMYDENDIMMDTAYYAYLNNMSQNSFYYARTIYDEIDECILTWSNRFLNSDLDNDVIYIFRDGDYTKEYSDIVKNMGAKEYKTNGHIIILAK